ncbi:hypothetical protein NMY22_g12610 [Coprinellus aureogranulatus]|nr:hypothetical protein NMY22_g12610 [Coprinellus aureogranulatus]
MSTHAYKPSVCVCGHGRYGLLSRTDIKQSSDESYRLSVESATLQLTTGSFSPRRCFRWHSTFNSSALHLEVERWEDPLYTFEFPVFEPDLALLGDIDWTRDVRLFTWLEAQLARFERVFFVSGNHEPYANPLALTIPIST